MSFTLSSGFSRRRVVLRGIPSCEWLTKVPFLLVTARMKLCFSFEGQCEWQCGHFRWTM